MTKFDEFVAFLTACLSPADRELILIDLDDVLEEYLQNSCASCDSGDEISLYEMAGRLFDEAAKRRIKELFKGWTPGERHRFYAYLLEGIES